MFGVTGSGFLALTLDEARRIASNIAKRKSGAAGTGRPELVACLDYLREGDLLLITKIDRLARSTSDLYKIISQLQAKGVEFKVLDDPSIDTTR